MWLKREYENGVSQAGGTVGHNCVADGGTNNTDGTSRMVPKRMTFGEGLKSTNTGHQGCLVGVGESHGTCREEKVINVPDGFSTHTLVKKSPNTSHAGNNYTPPKTQVTEKHMPNCTYITNKDPQLSPHTGITFLPHNTQAAGIDSPVCTHITNKDPQHNTHTGNNFLRM